METNEIKINEYVTIVLEYHEPTKQNIITIRNSRGEKEYKFQEIHLFTDTIKQILSVAEGSAIKVLYK